MSTLDEVSLKRTIEQPEAVEKAINESVLNSLIHLSDQERTEIYSLIAAGIDISTHPAFSKMKSTLFKELSTAKSGSAAAAPPPITPPTAK
jgi:hypothetical protein